MDARERALKLCDGDEYAMLHVTQVEAAITEAERKATEEERAACAAVARLSEERADFTGHSTPYMHGWQDASQVIRQGLEARGEENQGEPA